MSGHHKWSTIKHKRDSIEWTGSNVEEVEAFAIKHGFGFSVGSPIHCSLDHDHFDWDGTDPCKEDEDVLEVYTADWFRRRRRLFGLAGPVPATWTHADPGDTILANGRVSHSTEKKE